MDTRLTALIGTSLLLAACNAQPAKEDAAKTQSPPLSAEVPPEVIVSTNEPFQTAEVGGGRILLKTPDEPEGAAFAVSAVAASRTPEGAKRSWAGSGGKGSIEVEVRTIPCTDSMSGAAFPMSGAITLGEVRTEGCAREAGTPPPGAGK